MKRVVLDTNVTVSALFWKGYPVDCEADYIISGDKHLLDLVTYSGIPILKAKDFLIREEFLKEG